MKQGNRESNTRPIAMLHGDNLLKNPVQKQKQYLHYTVCLNYSNNYEDMKLSNKGL